MISLAKWLGVRSEKQKAFMDAPKRRLSSLTSDLQHGQDFCDYTGDKLIYCDDEGRFYHRQCDVFEPVSIEFVKGLVMDYSRSFTIDTDSYEEAKKLKAAQSMPRINAIVDVTKSTFRRSSKEFDSDPLLVGCQNGVLDLRAGELIEPEIVVTKRLGTIYNEHAWCHQSLEFLDQVFASDREKIAFIRRAIGYTLTGSTNGQCMFVAKGTGANGKSTLLKLIQALMGDYARAVADRLESVGVSSAGVI